MRCCSVHPRLSAYLDGELSQRQCRKVESHLTQCSACRQTLRQLDGVNAMLRMVDGPPRLSETFWADLKGKCLRGDPCEESAPLLSRLTWRWAWAGVSFAALLASAVGWVAWNQLRPHGIPQMIDVASVVLEEGLKGGDVETGRRSSELASREGTIKSPVLAGGALVRAAEEILLLHSARDIGPGLSSLDVDYAGDGSGALMPSQGIVPASSIRFVSVPGR